LETITKAVGIGKNPFKSLTLWGVALYQLAEVIAPVVCAPEFPFALPEAWCFGMVKAIEVFGVLIGVLGARRAMAR